MKLKQSQVPNLNEVIPKMSSLEVNLSVAITNIHLPMFLIAFQYPVNDLEFDIYLTAPLLLYLKVHKHEIFFLTFFAETETLWSQGCVTRDF